jgi:Fe-S-cluster containining protein
MKSNKWSLYKWCKNCTSVCCERVSDLIPTDKDIEKIQKFLDKSKNQFIKYKIRHLKYKTKFAAIPSPKGKCIFYSNTNCLIQEAKPILCLAYPIFFSFDLEKKTILWLKDIKCHAKLTKKWVKKAKNLLIKHFISELSLKSLAAYQTIKVENGKYDLFEEQKIPINILRKINKVKFLIEGRK